MEPFVRVEGRFVALDRADVNTDLIIPARFLKRIERTGFGELLFMDLKAPGGVMDPTFPINRPEVAGSVALVSAENFGCGSSREHAVWALAQWGFRAVIAPRVGAAPGFADIFRNNCYKNSLLPVEVSPEFARRLLDAGAGEIVIDLEREEVTAIVDGATFTERFSTPAGPRQMLLNGWDEIGVTETHLDAISAFEAAHPEIAPRAAA